MNVQEAKSKLKFYLIFTLVFWLGLPLLGFIVGFIFNIPDSPALEIGITGFFGVFGLLWLIETFRSFKAIYILFKSTKIVIPVLIFLGLLVAGFFIFNSNSDKKFIVGEDVFLEEYRFNLKNCIPVKHYGDSQGRVWGDEGLDDDYKGYYLTPRWYRYDNGNVITDGAIYNEYGLVAKIKDTFVDGFYNYYKEDGSLSRSISKGPNGLEDGLDISYYDDGGRNEVFWINDCDDFCVKYKKFYYPDGSIEKEEFNLQCDGRIKSFEYFEDGTLYEEKSYLDEFF